VQHFLPCHLVHLLHRKTHVILDRKGHIIGVLIAPPVPGREWDSVVQATTDVIRKARDKMTFSAGAYHHCCAYGDGEGFPTVVHSFAFGGGREEVGNIKALSARNAAATEELLEDPSIIRIATSSVCVPSFFFFPAPSLIVL
jgi:hypothetical protein